VLDNVRIDGVGPHGDLVAEYVPICAEVETRHIIASGEAISNTVEGGVLSVGNYAVTANFAMDTSLAFGSTSIEVE
jgi:hypothetical protein